MNKYCSSVRHSRSFTMLVVNIL